MLLLGILMLLLLLLLLLLLRMINHLHRVSTRFNFHYHITTILWRSINILHRWLRSTCYTCCVAVPLAACACRFCKIIE
ncbi:unnamed protein product [Brugia timori]|uniref:Uncharacterized protein n=1 Tax=Brugia timori TaxID=42155 RepID=A0A3P7T830_9BILA|nr:unnamed protein product [Brugia timori]